MYKIGIDLGGTKIEVAILQNNSSKPIVRKRIPTNANAGYATILQKISQLVQELKQAIPPRVKTKIGIGIPGFVSKKTGRILNSNTQCLNGQNLQTDLANIFLQKVMVENDANCFALSEACWGAAQDANLVLGIIIGTGMGGGLIFQKKILSGCHGFAGEIGHLSSNFFGDLCWCTQKGCHETYLSGTAMQNKFAKIYNQNLSVLEIYNLFLAQDKRAITFFQNFLQNFGRIMSNLILAIQPEKIVLGGGVSNLPLLYQEGVDCVKKSLAHQAHLPAIVPNKLGDASGVFGAALLA